MRQAAPDGREAQVHALDGVYRSADKSTVTEFTLAHTQAGLRSDPEPMEGWRGRLNISRRWRSGWAAGLTAVNASSGFNPNDLGYLNRADEQRLNLDLERRWDRTFGVLRNLEVGVNGGIARNQAGHVFQREAMLYARTDFTNFFALWAHLGAAFSVDDDRELRSYYREEPVTKYLRTSQIPWASLGFDTPGNRPWYLRAEAERAWHDGGPTTSLSVYQAIKLGSAIELQLDTTVSRSEGEQKYISPPQKYADAAAPMVGLRTMGQLNQTLRVAYALSPTLSIQFFSQWLDANWAYRDIQHYVDDRTLAPGLTPGLASVTTASSERVWNVNLITRWEFRPGSAFFLVYTHGTYTDALINDRASISPRHDLPMLRHLPSDDAVQMKISWLFR